MFHHFTKQISNFDMTIFTAIKPYMHDSLAIQLAFTMLSHYAREVSNKEFAIKLYTFTVRRTFITFLQKNIHFIIHYSTTKYVAMEL